MYLVSTPSPLPSGRGLTHPQPPPSQGIYWFGYGYGYGYGCLINSAAGRPLPKFVGIGRPKMPSVCGILATRVKREAGLTHMTLSSIREMGNGVDSCDIYFTWCDLVSGLSMSVLCSSGLVFEWFFCLGFCFYFVFYLLCRPPNGLALRLLA